MWPDAAGNLGTSCVLRTLEVALIMGSRFAAFSRFVRCCRDTGPRIRNREIHVLDDASRRHMLRQLPIVKAYPFALDSVLALPPVLYAHYSAFFAIQLRSG